MASSATHIPDALAAIRSGEIPGAFSEDGAAFCFPRLTYVSARGATHHWTVCVRLFETATNDYVVLDDWMWHDPLAAYTAEITVESLQAGGKTRDAVPTYVAKGKNLGKKNATNPLTQAVRDALGMFNRHRKRADVVEQGETIGDAVEPDGDDATPAVPRHDERPPPMLVQKIDDSSEATLRDADFAEGVTAQRKYNGVHCVVYRAADGRIVFYSRTGTEYPVQPQLAAEMSRLFDACPPVVAGKFGATEATAPAYAVPDGAPSAPYFAGELYVHGRSLNWISGQARRGDNDALLEFHIFDVFFPRAKEASFAAGDDMRSRDRQAYIDAALAAVGAPPLQHVRRIENRRVGTRAELDALAAQWVADGYEGAIARKDAAGYRYSYSNYHSGNLVKIKPVHDAEYPVVGYTQGTKGKDVGALIWECEVPAAAALDPADRRFTVVPKDTTLEERKRLFRLLGEPVTTDAAGAALPAPMTRFERDVKGRPLTVAYAELSAKTGKPLQPKGLIFRTYEGGPEADPLRSLFAPAP